MRSYPQIIIFALFRILRLTNNGMPIYHFYQIVAKDTRGVEVPTCYIGCTRSPLHKRFYEHKKNRTSSSRLLLEKYGAENCSIRLLRSVDCERDEAIQEERRLIEQYGEHAVNIRIPGRTSKELYLTNREEVLQNMKQYYQDHRTRIKARCLTYYYDNKKMVQEKTHSLVECVDCGKTLKYMSLSVHRKKACRAKHPSSHTSEPRLLSDPLPEPSLPVPLEQE